MTDQPRAGRDPEAADTAAPVPAAPDPGLDGGPDGGTRPPTPAVPDTATSTAPAAAPATGQPAPGDGVEPPASRAEPAEGAGVPAEGEEAVPAGPRRRTGIAGYLGAAVLGIAIGAGGIALASGAVGGTGATPSPSPTASPADNTVGSPGAPVTMEVWADYQCPFCRLEDVLFGGSVERDYAIPGVVQVVYRDFAFLGQESTDAAVAARCAGRQEPAARLRYHDALYTFQQGENEGRFVRENLVQIAQIVGVPDAAAFEACLDDPAVATEVAEETAAGRNVGVSSTPTIRLRGPGGERVLTGFSQQWSTLRDAIEAVRVAPASPGPSGSPAASASPAGSASPAPSAEPTATPASPVSPSASPAP